VMTASSHSAVTLPIATAMTPTVGAAQFACVGAFAGTNCTDVTTARLFAFEGSFQLHFDSGKDSHFNRLKRYGWPSR
jgi:hypothetical protein